jgi:gas vesicle protein
MSRRNRQRDNIKKVAIGSTIAAIAGYIAGILTAPKSGKETRGDIKDAADKGIAEAEKDLKKVQADLDKIIKEAKVAGDKLGVKAQKELSELVEKAKDTKEKSREVLSAIKEGGADNKDLDKAVQDAGTALQHLRDYLKKK